MSEDKLSEEEMREEIKNLISWGHAHDYDDIIKEARADAWDAAIESLTEFDHINSTVARWFKEDNPYRDQEEA